MVASIVSAPCLFGGISNVAKQIPPALPVDSYVFTRRIQVLSLRKRRCGKVDNHRLQIVAEVDKSLSGSRGPKEVVMVDPLEAKRLAVEQMKQLEAQAKFKRKRKIEAINGGWAMLGLTCGLVIEGYSGKGIILQVAGYLNSFADFIERYISL